MNVKVRNSMQLIKEIDFRPLEKFVVSLPKVARTYMGPQTIVDKELSTEENTVTKVVSKKIKYNHQVMLVVSTPETEKDITSGDSVLVDFRACQPLDGYDNLYLIPKYNIIGVIGD
jgi:hypothetical protein